MPSNITYDYGCLMVDLKTSNWFQQVSRLIDTNHLSPSVPNPLEDIAHITIVYGFDPSVTFDSIRTNLLRIQTFNDIRVVGLSYFDNPNYDVLYLKVASEQCRRANMYFRSNFKVTAQYPIYTPHITLAYLKKGFGVRYTNRLQVAGNVKANAVCYRFTTPNGKSYITKGYIKDKDKYAVT